MSLNPSTKTVNDISQWVKRQFGDESGAQITDQDILRWINLGLLEIATLSKVIQGVSTTDFIAGQSEYTLPVESAVELTAIKVNGKVVASLEFQQATEWVMKTDPDGSVTGDPQYWWRWANTIYFWPTPATSYLSGLKVFYVGYPAAVVNLSDSLGIPDKYFEALLQFVMSKAFELDEDYGASKEAKQSYLDKMGQEYEEDKSSALYYPTIVDVD